MPDIKRLTKRLIEIHRETFEDGAAVVEGLGSEDFHFIPRQVAVAMEAFRWAGFAIDTRPASAMYKAVFQQFDKLLGESWEDGFHYPGMYSEADFAARVQAMLDFFSKDGKTISEMKSPPARPPFALPKR